MVNIPGAQIEAVEDGRVVSRHAGVVGKIDRPTPILKSAVHEMNFNPVWHLPPTVISKDLIPKGREMQRAGQSVLVKYGIDAYDGTGKKLDPNKVDWNAASAQGLSFKQQPGKENPMGFLKINFHNQYSVYMHDTPSESLFGRNFRAASSGCVRVSGIEQLAAWMLSDNGDWNAERIQQIKKSGERADVRLKRAGAAVLRLHHGVGDRGRRRAVPPRPVPEGWHRRGCSGVLTASRSHWPCRRKLRCCVA